MASSVDVDEPNRAERREAPSAPYVISSSLTDIVLGWDYVGKEQLVSGSNTEMKTS